MKLVEKPIDIKSSGIEDSVTFGIHSESEHLIMDILRSKVYSDPIGSICREIASNSRDSHREAGCGDRPIKIELISPDSSNFLASFVQGTSIVFTDYGVGLSPERIRDVYSKYGASTKRDSNAFTGGFGLGAKTPFSYVDAFMVKSNFEGTTSIYSIYIDETKKGKISTIYTGETTEPNGVEVIIPVERTDVSLFVEGVQKATVFWDVQPILVNIPKSQLKITFESDDSASVPHGFCSSSHMYAIIDGIQYKLDTQYLGVREYAGLFVRFNTGDVTVTANRENIQYDTNSIKVLNIAFSEVLKYTKARITSKVNEAKTLAEAAVILNEIYGGAQEGIYGIIDPDSVQWESPSGKKVKVNDFSFYPLYDMKQYDKTYSKYKSNTILLSAITFGKAIQRGAVYQVSYGDKIKAGVIAHLKNEHPNGFLILTQKEPVDLTTLTDKYIIDVSKKSQEFLDDSLILQDIKYLRDVTFTTARKPRVGPVEKKVYVDLASGGKLSGYGVIIDHTDKDEPKAVFNGVCLTQEFMEELEESLQKKKINKTAEQFIKELFNNSRLGECAILRNDAHAKYFGNCNSLHNLLLKHEEHARISWAIELTGITPYYAERYKNEAKQYNLEYSHHSYFDIARKKYGNTLLTAYVARTILEALNVLDGEDHFKSIETINTTDMKKHEMFFELTNYKHRKMYVSMYNELKESRQKIAELTGTDPSTAVNNVNLTESIF